jgi:excisionase family DNA binding protein
LARSRGGFRFAYGVPLRQDDILLGVLCVADRQPRQLAGPERDAVTVVARQMTAELKQLREPAPVSRPAPAAMAPPERAPNPDHRAPTSRMMRSREVAALFDVTERTISNWVANGKLIASRTGGGHLRIRSDDVYSLLAERTADSRVA